MCNWEPLYNKHVPNQVELVIAFLQKKNIYIYTEINFELIENSDIDGYDIKLMDFPYGPPNIDLTIHTFDGSSFGCYLFPTEETAIAFLREYIREMNISQLKRHLNHPYLTDLKEQMISMIEKQEKELEKAELELFVRNNKKMLERLKKHQEET